VVSHFPLTPCTMVEKLALVSKITVMLDSQAIELVKENRELKDQLAWLMHGPNALNKALAENNTNSRNAICTCHNCLMARQFLSLSKDELMDTLADENEERVCILKKCLIPGRHCNRKGLSCEEHDNTRDDDDTPYLDEEFADTSDSHLVLLGRTGFWEVFYGKKIQLKGFHDSPEHKQLQELFDPLEDEDPSSSRTLRAVIIPC
jgi:hypothetical protein